MEHPHSSRSRELGYLQVFTNRPHLHWGGGRPWGGVNSPALPACLIGDKTGFRESLRAEKCRYCELKAGLMGTLLIRVRGCGWDTARG